MRKTDFGALTRRTYRIAAVLGILGTIGAGALAGVGGAIGFGLGAAFSGLNFHLWHRTVRRVGESGGSSGGGVMFGFRYILFALAGYAILNYFEANVLAALVGCFVSVAAVILEILLELLHGT